MTHKLFNSWCKTAIARSDPQLLAFGDRLALQLAGKNPAEIKALIDHQIKKVLNELRQYDPRVITDGSPKSP